MKKAAIYGYGVFGKRTAESFRLFWGGEYLVTAIFDRDRAGEEDAYWALTVLCPGRMRAEYDRGTYEAVMVCISDERARTEIEEQIAAQGIPVFVPGREEDFAPPGAFRTDSAPAADLHREKYRRNVYRDMLGAVADHARWQLVFLFDESGRLDVENYRKYMKFFRQVLLMYPFRLRDPLPEKVYMEGDYCVIAKAFSPNYWHFTFEMADCVYLLEKAGFRGRYIFNDVPFARQLLEVLGVGPDRLLATRELDIHKVYAFERLFDIRQTGMRPAECSPDVLCEMAGFVSGRLGRDGNSPKRIFVKRIGRRRLLNGEKTAVRSGFTVIVPEEYSVAEQMALFHNADIVLCPHGANSANCLYMRPGTVFAEIFSDRWAIEINEPVCGAIGVHYMQMTGKACADGREGSAADYNIDEAELQRMILEAEQFIAKG